jgi:hypothetical protein
MVVASAGCAQTVAPVDAEVDATDDHRGSACHNLDPGNLVQGISIASDPPALRGGVVSEGIYRLVAIRNYTGTGGESGRYGYPSARSIEVVGDEWRWAFGNYDGSSSQRAYGATFAGNRIEFRRRCPDDGESFLWPFEVSGGRLVIMLEGPYFEFVRE